MSRNAVLLPVTRFPARISAALRTKHDKDIQQKCKFDSLYRWQRENLSGAEYVLHDGPPYANGDLHMGHAINKIAKDIANRHRVINGRRVHYVPGWDCHGLPIELKALKHAKSPQTAGGGGRADALRVRAVARKFALDAADRQRSAFRSWGVMADWDAQCYYTLDKRYVQNQLRHFYELYEKRLVYRDVKPVHWSPSSRTALAESELEYDPNHESTEIYLKLEIASMSDKLKSISSGKKLYVIIWTTTPWSLVANQAVCYSKELAYSILQDKSCDNSLYLVASSLVQQLEKILGRNFTELCTVKDQDLSDLKYLHPLKPNHILPFLPADHVSAEKGTGLVHTAPAHGPEDFLVALKNNIKIESHIDDEGKFVNTFDWLDKSFALGDGQSKILEKLKPSILHSGSFKHSYPLDWRTKKPVILRASNQWFMDTSAIKKQSLEAIENINIMPAVSSKQYKEIFMRQVQNRPYWCISRQRVWGIPIPAVYHNGKPLINGEMIENICRILNEEGPDGWWNNSMEEFVPQSLLDENNVTLKDLEKGTDIMDIWLDSGLTWKQVLGDKKADLYLEGLDQFNGWFQSSLLTGVALSGSAPFKNLFVHGFAVDSEGRKMSKSLGNVVDPQVVIAGGKNQNKDPPFGIDTLRWWVACHGTHDSKVAISKNILESSAGDLSRLRLLLKFMLGCINDLDSKTVDSTEQFGYLDSYMLHLLHGFKTTTQNSYDLMQFNKVCTSILYFASNHVSGFYSHAIKDRLYCEAADSKIRRDSQVVLHTVLMHLLRELAPVAPHLAEEAWAYHPMNAKEESLFCLPPEVAKPIWERPFVDDLMETIFEMKRELTRLCSGANTLEFSTNIRLNPEMFDRLLPMQKTEEGYHGDLCDILHVSRVRLMEGKAHEDEWKLSVEPIERKLCKRCRKFTSKAEEEPCDRCASVMNRQTVDVSHVASKL